MRLLPCLLLATVACTARPVASAPDYATTAATVPGADSLDRLAAVLAAQVTIHRDQWGVPHVLGRTDASTVFGFAYAQAEDHFWRLEDDFIRALGRRAEVEGERAVGEDRLNRALEIPRLARAEYARMEPRVRALVDAYAAGVNHYLAAHPEVRPRLLARVEPWYPLAFIRYNYYQNGFLGQAGLRRDDLQLARLDDGERAGDLAGGGERGLRSNVGSNGWVVGRERSASGHPLLLVNPHLPFAGPGQVYEGHVLSEEGWNFTGYTRLGFPLPYVGHNEHLGWVSTDNYADQADGWLVRFDDPARPLAYRHGDDWRMATEWTDTLRVRTGAGTVEARAVTLRKTHHGPIVGSRNGVPIAVRLARLEEDGWLGEWYAMTRARSVAELRQAMEPLAMLFGNVMAADRDGGTFYLYNAAVPRRDARFDWRGLVDGNDPATDWRGYHALSELPQLVNPEAGWMQNCNSSPFLLTSAGNPDPNAFPRYMVTEGDNPRAKVSRELLQATPRWTFDAWARAAFDTRVGTADSVVPLLLADVARSTDARLRAAADTLRRWDRRASTGSVAMTLYALWREREQEARSRGAAAPDRAATLAAVLGDLERDFAGRWTVPWGEVSRHQRPDERREEPFADERPSLPVPGVNGADGAVFTYYARPQPGQRRRYGMAGGTYVSVVEFGPRVRGLSVHVYGASGDPASPHYFDQAAMYARGELKPAWLHRDDVLANARRSYAPGAERAR